MPDVYRTYYDATTGAYLGSYRGPEQHNPYSGHPSVEGQYPRDTTYINGVLTQPTEAEREDAVKTERAELREDILRAVALVFLDEVNTLRHVLGLQPRTAQQLKAAIKARL